MSRERLEEALNNWQAKRNNYEYELSITADPEKKFELPKKIEECEKHIERLNRVLQNNNPKTTITPPYKQGTINFQSFNFDVRTVDYQGGLTNYKCGQAKFFAEDLGNDVTLEMVEIPGGKFMMGSPVTEKRRRESESPQHKVTVQPFFMGKYPVTQVQWKAVAALPKVSCHLQTEPSRFKGDNLPVEQVSWYDAVEFCARLSKKTRRTYRLPSEAEWEYACRAGTTTPFHFGKTITTDLANYDDEYIYASEPKGKSRMQTTPVGYFLANAFGLYDMHGNVSEWCEDNWHPNYRGAPTDSRAWLSDNNNDYRYRMLRGGSWIGDVEYCRSACRYCLNPDCSHYGTFGFRVLCETASTF